MRVRIGKRASLRRVLGAGSTQKQSFLPAEWHAQRASWVRLPVIHRTRLTRIAPAREPTEDACRSFAGRREKPQEYASSFLVADAPHPHAGPAGKGHSSSRLPIFRMRGRIGEPLETALVCEIGIHTIIIIFSLNSSNQHLKKNLYQVKNYAGPNQTSDRLNPIEPTKKYRGGPIWPLRSLTSLRARGRVRGGPVSIDKEEKKAVPSRTLCGGPFRRGRDGRGSAAVGRRAVESLRVGPARVGPT